MNLIYNICIAISFGIIMGFLWGCVKLSLNKNKVYTQKQIQLNKNIINSIAFAVKYITFLFLILGLIWCTYFLILGAAVPEQSEYANNMSSLIVAILTIVSIIFAFIEFLKFTDK